MDIVQLAMTFALSPLAGAVISYLIFSLPLRTKNERLAVTADRVTELEEEISNLRNRLDEFRTRNTELETIIKEERNSHTDRVGELTKMGDELERKFTILAGEALGKNSENFMQLVTERFEKHKEMANEDLAKRQKEIETLVKPLSENLSKFEIKVGEIEKARVGAYEAVSEQIKILAEGQTGLKSETTRLVQALRQPKTRGRWGEYQLRNVLEMAGMSEHVDFVEQPTIAGNDHQLRPDVIVRVPGGKSVIVDAKTPLEAYLTAIETTNEDARERLFSKHARQVQDHVRALASKEYWRSLPETPDFVVMFVPGETFYSAAMESSPDLFENAVRQRVLICTPTTLIALIKAIAYGWQQEKLAENAQAIESLGRDLFERIRTFGEHMDRLGRSLKQAIGHYNKGVGSLEGRVLPAARRFETLGVAASGDSIPVIEQMDIDARGIQAEELTRFIAEE
ncbi:MAG: DNA recombination protein RmuC [Albidovulum sp.]|nr:DNA recombination protein RmuC [Albidovulum sp.]